MFKSSSLRSLITYIKIAESIIVWGGIQINRVLAMI